MALEPADVTLDQGPNEELLDMTRRLWIGGALSLPVVALDMGGHVFNIHSTWIELLFATPVVLWAGWPFFVRGMQSVVRRSLNMFTLIAIGTGAAWLYSVVATLAPQLFPQSFRDMCYNRIAINRYRLFGRYDAVQKLDADHPQRFLD